MQHVQPAVGLAFEHFEPRMHAGIAPTPPRLPPASASARKYARPPAVLVLHAVRRASRLSPQISRHSAAMSAAVLPIVADFDGKNRSP